MSRNDPGSPLVSDAVRDAGRRDLEETLEAGHAVAYVDEKGLNILHQPDGRRFEIRWVPAASASRDFEIVRELLLKPQRP